MKNFKNKKVTNFCQKFNFINKSSNLCPCNIIKFKESSKNLSKKNFNPTKRFNSMNKTSNLCKFKKQQVKMHKKKINLFVNLNNKIENLSTNWIVSKVI